MRCHGNAQPRGGDYFALCDHAEQERNYRGVNTLSAVFLCLLNAICVPPVNKRSTGMASVFKSSRKRKRALREQAELMRKSKFGIGASSSEEQGSIEHAGPSQAAENLDESLQLPRPIEESDVDGSSSDSECSDDDPEVSTATVLRDEIQGVYDDWLFSLGRDDKKMMAMMMYDSFVSRFGLRKTAAAVEVGQVMGISDKSIRVWRQDFLKNGGSFSEYQRGRYERYVVIEDEEFKEMALTWIRSNSSVKGRPNMTAANFRSWVVSVLLPQVKLHHPQVPSSISDRTAVRWLHQLGFEPASTKKGVFIDGHERSDVVEYRKLYLRKLEILESTHAPPPPISGEPAPVSSSDRRKLVLIFHDEVVYHSNDDQKWMWSEKGKQPIRPKSQGRALMVSDFIEEHNGYLRLSDEEFDGAKESHPELWKEARRVLKLGAEHEGYWDSEKFLTQVDHSITIAEIKYPKESHSLVFLFDQSSGHTAFSNDALNVNRMNVRPGGSQAILRDTVWDGKTQKMCFSDGTAKGMQQVLEERGVNTRGMKASRMREVLGEMSDFKFEKTKVERLVSARGYRAIFIPKFHCELNPIESCWCHSKRYTRSHCNYTFPGLQATIDPSLNSVTLEMIRKFFRKTRETMKAYREGLTPGPEMTRALKIYKSHRRVSDAQ